MRSKALVAAVIIELTGIAIVGVGIGLEIVYSESIYLVVITIGSVIIATGGVIFGKFFRMHK